MNDNFSFLFLSTDLALIYGQLFGDNDVFQQYGIPMSPTDAVIPGLEERQRNQNDDASASSATGSQQLISYQHGQNPIDFTDFLNLDENQLTATSGSLTSEK